MSSAETECEWSSSPPRLVLSVPGASAEAKSADDAEEGDAADDDDTDAGAYVIGCRCDGIDGDDADSTALRERG